MSVIHSEVIKLQASAEQVRGFVMSPERILDYYPDPIEGAVLIPGKAIFCRGKAGISLLQIDSEKTTDRKLVVEVFTARKVQAPVTAEAIREGAFFYMVEDWELEPLAAGCRLTKTWRDLRKFKLRFLPMRWIVRKSAKHESEKLRVAWDEAASAD